MVTVPPTTGGFRSRGGGWTYRHDIIAALPPAAVFVDLFCGSAAFATAAVESGKYSAVVANDANRRMTRMLMVMRDRAEELNAYLMATPHSRAQFEHSCANMDAEDDIAAAANTLIVCSQSAGRTPNEREGGGWHSPGVNKGERMSQRCAREFKRTNERVRKMQSALLGISFETRDWQHYLNLLEKRRGAEQYLVFCDPPYKSSGHCYAGEFNHDDFLHAVRETEMMMVVMESAHEHLPELESAGWRALVCNEARAQKSSKGTARLWFSPCAWGGGMDLFSMAAAR